MKNIVKIGPDRKLTPHMVRLIAYDSTAEVVLTKAAKNAINRCRALVDKMVDEKRVIYGVTTGFGNFKNKAIDQKDVEELQKNLIRSHSAGVGDPIPLEMVKAAMVVRLNSLSQGFSGVRLDLVNLLVEMINRNVIPVVPSQGSVGASGDLAPLSHMGLVLMGEGLVWYRGKMISGSKAIKLAGLKPITFMAKEGLAWNNGTAVMSGISAILVDRALNLIDVADGACALTLEAVCGVNGAFDPLVHKLRPHPGQIKSAAHINSLVAGSKLVDSSKNRVQDSYSLRCSPQVHGAIRDAMTYVADTLTRELNSVTDNPLIFVSENKAISGGNFHGEPIAIAMDTFGIAIAELGDISERRTAKLVDSSTNEGLPLFLISPDKAGLHSGFMIPQYTAAALVSENKVLAHPASIDSIPTSANQEDHVSMGSISARKAISILKNVENIIAIEMYTAAQGIDFRGGDKLGARTKKIYKAIRSKVKYLANDREMAGDIGKINKLIVDGALV